MVCLVPGYTHPLIPLCLASVLELTPQQYSTRAKATLAFCPPDKLTCATCIGQTNCPLQEEVATRGMDPHDSLPPPQSRVDAPVTHTGRRRRQINGKKRRKSGQTAPELFADEQPEPHPSPPGSFVGGPSLQTSSSSCSPSQSLSRWSQISRIAGLVAGSSSSQSSGGDQPSESRSFSSTESSSSSSPPSPSTR